VTHRPATSPLPPAAAFEVVAVEGDLGVEAASLHTAMRRRDGLATGNRVIMDNIPPSTTITHQLRNNPSSTLTTCHNAYYAVGWAG